MERRGRWRDFSFCLSCGTQIPRVYLSLGDMNKSKLYFYLAILQKKKRSRKCLSQTGHPTQGKPEPKNDLFHSKKKKNPYTHIGSGVNYN